MGRLSCDGSDRSRVRSHHMTMLVLTDLEFGRLNIDAGPDSRSARSGFPFRPLCMNIVGVFVEIYVFIHTFIEKCHF